MGNDYIFFDASLRDRFVQFLNERSHPFDTRADTIEGFIVALRDEPADAALEDIEAHYQALMDEQMLLAESHAGWVTHQAVGITVTRADGTTQVVRLSAELARPLLEHFSAEQAQALVQAIALSLDRPASGPLCRPQPAP